MFIPNNKDNFGVGSRVRLKRDISTFRGTFTAGHEFMIVRWHSIRGPDLRDDEGRELNEMGLKLDALEAV